MRKLTLFAFIFGIALSCTVTSNLMAQSVETYESLMKSGNEKFAAQDYFSAKTYFEMALKQKANDASAQKRLNETLSKIREDNEKQEVFYAHLDQGDALYNQKKYEEALTAYNSALSIFPGDKYVTSQTDAIRKILQDRQAKIDDFNLAMTQGASLMESQNYDAAILQFQTASQIFPDDEQSKIKIAEATQLQKTYNENVNHFNKLIQEANVLSARKNFDAAIEKLNQALVIFPDNNDVKAQISALSASKSQTEQYNSIIAEADKFYENKSYKDSKSKYQEALSVAPNDAYANDMIQRINQLFESPEYIAQENYQKAIEKAKELENQSQIAMALSSFQEALTYKPNDDFATQKVSELSEFLNNQAIKEQTEQQFNELFAKAEKAEKNNELNDALSFYMDASELKPENEAAKKKVIEMQNMIQNLEEADKLYAQQIADADKLFNSQNFEGAITAYRNALAIKPNETYPQQQIDAAQNGIENLAAAAEQKAIDDSYNTAIAEADKLFNSQNFEGAITAYRNALNIKPNETYPQQQIDAAQNGIENLAAAAEQKAIDDSYNAAIAEADILFNSQNFEGAIAAYRNALTIKPNETYPQQQIDAAQNGIENLAAAAEQKAIDDRYNAAIAEADKLFNSQNFEGAITAYRNALTIKPNETYPQQQIDAAQNGIENLAAAAEQKAIDDRYNAAIAEADKLFNSQNFEGAITAYRNALTIKPNETYPQQQIDAAQNGIENLAAAAEQKAIDDRYNAAIAEADKLFNSQNFEGAITAYRNALTIKPNETYPQQQIDAAQNGIENLAAAAERQERINSLLAEAEEYFVGKDYQASKNAYLEVKNLDAENSVAIARINEIDNLLAQIAQERQQNYEAAMNAAEQFMAAQNYAEAISQYQLALENKTDDALATAQLAAAQKIESDRIAALTSKYNGFIKEADAYFKNKEFDKAIDFYTQAQDLGLEETYPSEMIAQINQIMKDHMLIELNNSPLLLPAGKSQRFNFNPIDYANRRGSYVILKVRNLDPTKSFPMIVSFGSQGKQNGGFVVPISKSDEAKTYIIKIGSVYRWFSEDNIWIEMIAEKGDVEIDLVEISKGN